MAQQTVTLQPGESKVVSFEATPAIAKTFQVSVDGLTGSFKAVAPLPVTARLYGYITDNETGEPVVGANGKVYQDYDSKTADYDIYTDENGFYEIIGMIPEVSASMYVYAGGYEDYTKTGVRIHEGDNERNIVLTWGGGPRIVPKFVSYSLPSQIVSGEEFPVAMTVWLPYKTGVHAYCRMKIERIERINIIQGRFFTAFDWDRFNEYFKEKYLRFDSEGEYTLEAVAKAIDKDDKPLPPGIYEVSYTIMRGCIEVTETGTIRNFTCDEDYDTGSVVVGTIEVVPPPGFGGLTGTVTDPDTGERVEDAELDMHNLATGAVFYAKTNSEGEYEFNNIPVGDYTFTVTKEASFYDWRGGYTEVYMYDISIEQGWNERNILLPMHILPTGHFDPEDRWDYLELTYDRVPNSGAWSDGPANQNEWSPPFELIFDPPVTSDKARFSMVRGAGPEIDLDIHRDGVWVDVYQGAVEGDRWVEKTFIPGSIDRVRIRVRHTGPGRFAKWHFYEFQLFSME